MKNEMLLTPAQVADHIQIRERTVTRWLRDGYLHGYKLGKEWRIARDHLETFLEGKANRARHYKAPPTAA